jgi:2,4-dienoyl-CoA reductase-like NADH-dependent reductase (Old Yellow Enzyme family)
VKNSDSLEILFKPTRIGGVDLRNRIAMAPMTRAMSPGGVPGENVARYYRRRAEGGVGLIITEGTFIPHPSAGHDENAPGSTAMRLSTDGDELLSKCTRRGRVLE